MPAAAVAVVVVVEAVVAVGAATEKVTAAAAAVAAAAAGAGAEAGAALVVVVVVVCRARGCTVRASLRVSMVGPWTCRVAAGAAAATLRDGLRLARGDERGPGNCTVAAPAEARETRVCEGERGDRGDGEEVGALEASGAVFEAALLAPSAH